MFSATKLHADLLEAIIRNFPDLKSEYLQENAEQSVRDMLKGFAEKQSLGEKGSVTSMDHMDDGSPIALTVTVDAKEGSAEFDFDGTGPQVFNSCNAPPAVTYSAIIYSLRCLVKSEIPLNQAGLSPHCLHMH